MSETAKDKLAAIVDGLDGVTPGPWEVAEEGTYHLDEGGKVLGPQRFNSHGKPVRYYVAQYVLGPDAAHFSRLDPDSMRSIADAFAAMEAEVEALRAALDHNSAVCSTAEVFRISEDVTVESRGLQQWAVVRHRFVLATDGEWEYEPLPSSRSDDFIARTRHSFVDAMIMGRSLASTERKGGK